MRSSSVRSLPWPAGAAALALMGLLACASGDSKPSSGSGGASGDEGTGGRGGAGTGGKPGSGGTPGSGGSTGSGGAPGSGGAAGPRDAGDPVGGGSGGGGQPPSPDAGATDRAGAADAEPAPPPPGAFSDPAAVKLPTFPDRTCPVAAGANTAAINAAIASCSGMGGGVVTFAAGTYSVGSIHMKSNVKLQLNGATLRGTGGFDPAEPYTSPVSCQDEAHSHWHNAVLWGENLTNIAIVGPGTLEGPGLDMELGKLIALKSSTVMLFENLGHNSSGHFVYLLTDCHHITMAKLTMRPIRDGVDLMECTDVNAHDLTITGGPDDAFALKNDCTLGKPLGTSNVTVKDGTFGVSVANALQIGSETWGNFENIAWSNIKVTGAPKAGIGVQMNDGAVIKNVSYDNITMTGTAFPIFINSTSLLRGPTKTPGHAENIRLRNITASNIVAGNGPSPQNTVILISGQQGIPHKGIVLEHVKITFPGGGNRSGDPPEGNTLKATAEYNPRFITPVPAWGLFVRHAEGVELHDVKLDFGAAEQRPAVIARDVDGLVFDMFGAEKSAAPTLELEAIKNFTIKASAPLPETTLPAVPKMTY
jgi:hypothetical protein